MLVSLRAHMELGQLIKMALIFLSSIPSVNYTHSASSYLWESLDLKDPHSQGLVPKVILLESGRREDPCGVSSDY